MGLVGLLVAVAIIAFLAYLMSKQYFSKPTGMDQNTQEIAHQAGIDTTSQLSILDSAKATIKNAEDTEYNRN